MPAKSNVPIRICGSRSRSGCLTCKKRHVKCDEHRPSCFTCQKADRECIYNPSPSQTPQSVTSIQPEDINAISAATQTYSYPEKPTPSSNVSPYGARDAFEISALKSFVAHTGKELSGCFSDQVWCHVLPQVAHHEPSIWHAIVAISTLHSQIRLGYDQHDSQISLRTAIRQYSKAIQDLNATIQRSERTRHRDVVLLSCVLFAIFECLQNHYQSVLRHVASGLKLLAEWRKDFESGNGSYAYEYFDHASVQPIFISLDSQAVQLGALAFRRELSWQAVFDKVRMPTSFSSIQEAYVSLNHIFNRLHHWSEWIGPDTEVGNEPEAKWMKLEEERLQEQLKAWDSAFERPLKLFHPEPATILLLFQRKVLQICFEKTMEGPDEIGYDKYNELFREAVDHAEAFMQLTKADYETDTMHQKGPTSALTVTMDVVVLLFFISTKCRHPSVRKRALKMLKVCNRKEGMWESNICAFVAEKMIAFEESFALEDGTIPESSRIYIVDVRLEEERVQELVLKRLVRDTADHYHTESFKERVMI